MSKRKLNRRQTWRVEKIHQERADRAAKRSARAEEALQEGDLGPEQHGRVIAHYGTQVAIEGIIHTAQEEQESRQEVAPASTDEVYRCHLRANLGSLVTGDNVVWRAGNPIGVVVAVLPRRSELSRPDKYGDLKTIAANIDRIVIVVAPFPEPHGNLIDRYLVAAESLNIQPIILLNKIDLLDEHNRQRLDEMQARYQALGYEWLNASSKTAEGMQPLIRYLTHYTSVFVGQSGVGKSSLINTLLPEQDLKVGALSEVSQQGTHTTTTAQLYHFPAGGDLIDSPGIREFGLWHMEEQDLLEGFIEFRPFLGMCKFRDCAHQSEPGCAIRDAYENGDISPNRMASFRQILSTLEP